MRREDGESTMWPEQLPRVRGRLLRGQVGQGRLWGPTWSWGADLVLRGRGCRAFPGGQTC